MKKAWKCLKLVDGMIKSQSGNHTWQIDTWYDEKLIEACSRGFHASKSTIDAMQYVAPDVFAQVEYDGDIICHSDKLCAQRMRIVRVWKWTKPDSLRFSIFCVKQSLKYVDKKKFSEVFRVCLASIKAIEAVLLKDNEHTRSAASAAASAIWSAARSAESAAWSAESAARSAAWSAESAARAAVCSAARSAESAARSAARSAESAAWSAESAAWSAESAARSAESAARAAAKRLQHAWLMKYIKKNCEEIR